MGFYTTALSSIASAAKEEVQSPRQEKTHPPSKNRVWVFSEPFSIYARRSASQVLELHRENRPTPTKTVSDVRYYGYRFYIPEIGMWLSRDPMGRRIKPNLYAGMLNNPIKWIDADGRDESYWPPGNNAPPVIVISPDPNPPSPNPPSDSPSCPMKCLNFIKGANAGLKVRSEFLKMIDQYDCCVKGKIVGLGAFDGCKDGSQANWTVAHRITGCEMKAAGVDKDTMDNLNAIHETIEFCRGECGKFDDWGSYVDDTFKDMKAIQEGFGTDGKDCYNRFIPSECKKKAKK